MKLKLFGNRETPSQARPEYTQEKPAPFLTINAGQAEVRGRLASMMAKKLPKVGVTTEPNRLEIQADGFKGLNIISVQNATEQEVCISLINDINTCVTTVRNFPFKKKNQFAEDLEKVFARACGQASDAEHNFGGMLAAEFIQGVQQVARGTNSVFARYTSDALDEIGAATAGDTTLTRESWELGEKCAALTSKKDATVREWIAVLNGLQDLKTRAEVDLVPLTSAS